MPDSSDFQNINPQVRSVTIGKRTLRKISIYPLSLGDQLDLTDLINQAVNSFLQLSPDMSDEAMIQFVAFVLKLIKENIDRLLEMITSEGVTILKEITNEQLMDIVEVVYKDNFEGPIKKARSLFPAVKGQTEIPSSPLRKPSRRAVRSMVTD